MVTALSAEQVTTGSNPVTDLMDDHTTPPSEPDDGARFYPVDGIRGHCSCGEYLHYKSFEGEWQCPECGRVWNLYVECDLWDEQ